MYFFLLYVFLFWKTGLGKELVVQPGQELVKNQLAKQLQPGALTSSLWKQTEDGSK